MIVLVRKKMSRKLVPRARLAQSVEHETLNLRVVGSSPTLGEQFFLCQRSLSEDKIAATRDRTGDL